MRENRVIADRPIELSRQTVLAARDVTFAYGSSGPEVLHGVSLTVTRGEVLAIVGESGCGKTTLGQLVAGLRDPSGGDVLFRDRPWEEARRDKRARRAVQMVFQDPYAALNPMISALDAVSESFRIAGRCTRQEAREKSRQLLERVGIGTEFVDRRPTRLSGGQCQRVVIARALAAEPQVLIADEPTSSLDVSVQAQILALLHEIIRERELALVLVSHDLAVVRYMTDNVIVMYQGHVVERGPTHEIFRQPRHPYTRLLLASVPGSPVHYSASDNDVPADAACPFASRCSRYTELCAEAPPAVGKERARSWWCHHPLNTARSRPTASGRTA